MYGGTPQSIHFDHNMPPIDIFPPEFDPPDEHKTKGWNDEDLSYESRPTWKPTIGHIFFRRPNESIIMMDEAPIDEKKSESDGDMLLSQLKTASEKEHGRSRNIKDVFILSFQHIFVVQSFSGQADSDQDKQPTTFVKQEQRYSEEREKGVNRPNRPTPA